MSDDTHNEIWYEEGPNGTSGRRETDHLPLERQVPHAVIWYTELNRRQSTIALLNNAHHWPRPVTVLSAAGVTKTDSVEATAAERPRIVLAPGSRLMAWLSFLLPPAWYRLRIAPTIADMHEEYYQQLNAGNQRHARWIAIRGHILVVKVLVKGTLEAVKDLIF